MLDIGAAALNYVSFVWIVAIGATHLAFQDRMAMRQLETRAHFGVTLEASLRRFARIDDRVRRAATLDVDTSRTVTRFAADVLGVIALRL